ncbi:endonuclease [Mangrovimonas futianensis]|uniref:endonuclease n=1 Tax=Mangrovimonas futianensis TaxID=2895523 RepID=UPI001E5ABC7E|nr:endonuclease [Mangrovimonas futianensis]MCF1420310.1 endonuclease [Mangrovimonas futianensis]
MKTKYFLILFFFVSLVQAQIPVYYSSIDFNESPETIKSQLATLIETTHTTDLPYTSSQLDTWDAVEQTDEVLSNTDEVYLFYGYDNNDNDTQTDYTRDKDLSCHVSGCSGLWTREHVYARSLATPSLITTEPGSGTDVHNLRACDGDMNSSKGNRLFEDSTGNSHITNSGEWYPGDEWKGDVARIIMYMYLRYPTQCSANNTASSLNTFSTEMPDVFLDWNQQDPVSEVEIQRNDVLEGLQGNRNPFIDNPYLATLIWGGEQAEDTWALLSVQETEKKQIAVYPNPASTTLYISNPTNQKLHTTIYSINGQEIKIPLVNNKLDITKLSGGLYVLWVEYFGGFKHFKFSKI